MAPLPSEKRGSGGRREHHSLVGAGGWRREREQEQGALKLIHHPWFPHPFWKQMWRQHRLPARSQPGTCLLTPSPRRPAGCCDIWMPMCSSLCGAASFRFATRRTAGHQGLPANHQKLGEGPGTRSASQPWGHPHLPASRTRRPNMSVILSAPVCGTDGGSPVVGNTAST